MSATRGTSRLQAKLDAALKNKNYYEAQQLYKTIYNRLLARNNAKEAAQVTFDGALQLLQASNATAATELATLHVHCLENEPPTREQTDKLKQIYLAFPQEELENASEPFVKAVLKWFKKYASQASVVEMEAEMHDFFAERLFSCSNYPAAQLHFILGKSPEKFAEMIVKWSQMGDPKEVDLFCARAVFLYLAQGGGRTPFAKRLYESCRKAMYEDQNREIPPLMNFIRFLLAVIESGASSPQFSFLREKYAVTIARDPEFQLLLNRIGSRYFNQQPPGGMSGMGGVVGNLMRSIFGGAASSTSATRS